ncbi:MAG TPA: alpha/beta hydrolase [Alphaproteobacteria bacterium]|nr:alpha/beta hydrolase [Alphaproteobacteria bacterium]
MKWVLPIGCAFILVAALASSEGAQAAARGSAARPQSAEPGSGIPGTLETLEPRPGVTERVAVVPAAGEAKASLILFVGGNGRIGLEPDNVGRPFGNFLARTRGLFAGQGLEVALLDSPSDHRELDDWRASAEHATDIAAVIRFLHARVPRPVWLVGTSRGTISAANAAARLAGAPAEARPDGLVLTSSVTVPTRIERETVFSADLAAVRVPVLIVHHRSDACKVSPPSAVERLAHAFPQAPKVETMFFEGGNAPRSDDCQPFAPHGYFGIETQVVEAIARWIEANPPR